MHAPTFPYTPTSLCQPYLQWPEDALLSVARKFLAGTDLGGETVANAVASMCVSIHTSVAATSERFYAELRRHYYTTPKSYLDLINLYLQLLREKRCVRSAAWLLCMHTSLGVDRVLIASCWS